MNVRSVALALLLAAAASCTGPTIAHAAGCAPTSTRACTVDPSAPATGPSIDDSVPALQRPDASGGIVDYVCDLRNPPAPADPFAKHPTTTLFDQYCYAGYRGSTYDLGWTPTHIGDSVSAHFGTGAENTAVDLGISATVLADSAWNTAFDPTWLGTVANASRAVQDALSPLVWKYMALALTAAAIIMVWLSRQGRVASSFASLLMIGLVVVIASFALAWPARVATGAQVALKGLAVQVDTDVAGGQLSASSINDQTSNATLSAVHYRGWLQRTFGSATSSTATTYGPTLFKAGVMSRAEDKVCTDAPAGDACQRIYTAHAAAYKKVAGQIKKSDAEAYHHLQGTAGGRVVPAIVEALGAFASGWLRIVGALVIIAAVISLVLLACAAPIIALVAVLPGHHHIMRAFVVDAAGFALMFGAIFCAVGPLSSLFVSALLTAQGIPSWFALLLIGAVTVLLHRQLKPFRRIGQMARIGGKDVRGLRRGGRSVAGMVTGGIATAATSYFAGKAGTREALHEEQPAPTTTSTGTSEAFAGPAMPPPPPMPTVRPAVTPAGPALAAGAPAPKAVGMQPQVERPSAPFFPGEALVPTEATQGVDGEPVYVITDVYVPKSGEQS